METHAHHWLILHGRHSQGAQPECPRCVLIDLCGFKEKTGDAPAVAAKKPKPTKRKAAARSKSGD
jgi:endonuclease-3